MQSTPIPFFTRASHSPDFAIPYFGPVIKVSEKYWSFGRKCTIAESSNNQRIGFAVVEKEIPWLKIALKIAACITIIPLVLLGVKWFNRIVHDYTMQTRAPNPNPTNKTASPPDQESDTEELPKDLVEMAASVRLSPEPAFGKSLKKNKHSTKDRHVAFTPDAIEINEIKSYSLSTHPITLRKTEREIPEKVWGMADEAYADNNFPLAFVHYIDYALSTMTPSETWTVNGITAVKRVLQMQTQVLGREIIPQKDNSSNPLKDDFFKLIAFIRDHHEEQDPDVIADKLTHKIEPEKRAQLYTLSSASKMIDQHFFSKEINGYSYCLSSIAGRHEKMEDSFLVTSFSIEQKNQKSVAATVFAVFDGHGGTNASTFLAREFTTALKSTLDRYPDLSDKSIFNALKRVCLSLNEKLKTAFEKDTSGSTASLLLLLENGWYWCLNVGDSRIALKYNDNNNQCTEDAKPEKENFLNSILKRGGTVSWSKGAWRVGNNLAPARSFGDFYIPGITARAKVTNGYIPDADPNKESFFLIATDGLWDVIGTHNALDLIHCQIPEQERCPTVLELPKYLTNLAYEHGSMDNITVIAVDLKKGHKVKDEKDEKDVKALP